MGKVSKDDKMRIQTLREQGLGYRTITSKYPDKKWKLDTVKAICRRFDEEGSVLVRKPEVGDQRQRELSKTLRESTSSFVPKRNPVLARVPGRLPCMGSNAWEVQQTESET